MQTHEKSCNPYGRYKEAGIIKLITINLDVYTDNQNVLNSIRKKQMAQ